MPWPSRITVEGLNRVLSGLHLDPVLPEEVAPAVAAGPIEPSTDRL